VSPSRVRDATAEWRAIARGDDVLYHVCSWPEKKGKWTEEDFYASGRSDWEDFRSHWRHYEPTVGGAVLEIGCGAGRLSHVLAEDFTSVESLDVSEDMIARARAHSPTNVRFHQVDGSTVPLPDESVDAVFSVHVLQHLENADAVAAYLREAHRVLRPGGTIMAHIMLTSGTPPLGRRLRDAWTLRRSRAALSRGQEHNAVRMTMFTAGEGFNVVQRAGFSDIELRVFPVRSNGFHHSFFLARRPR
jgi:ubiquinone/menaquinone biosynthesis C-methylase UbiE